MHILGCQHKVTIQEDCLSSSCLKFYFIVLKRLGHNRLSEFNFQQRQRFWFIWRKYLYQIIQKQFMKIYCVSQCHEFSNIHFFIFSFFWMIFVAILHDRINMTKNCLEHDQKIFTSTNINNWLFIVYFIYVNLVFMDENIHFVSQKIYNCFLSCSISKVCHCKKFGHVHKILVIFIRSY